MQTVTDPFTSDCGAPTAVPSAAFTVDAGSSAHDTGPPDALPPVDDEPVPPPALAELVVDDEPVEELEQAARTTGRVRASRRKRVRER
ncbi:MAG TPA: hypothetical protein VGY51_01495 [Acidimicrobiales bacterium]|nr:hypothetical protein [Acidimicrobiales bacterium]